MQPMRSVPECESLFDYLYEQVLESKVERTIKDSGNIVFHTEKSEDTLPVMNKLNALSLATFSSFSLNPFTMYQNLKQHQKWEILHNNTSSLANHLPGITYPPSIQIVQSHRLNSNQGPAALCVRYNSTIGNITACTGMDVTGIKALPGSYQDLLKDLQE